MTDNPGNQLVTATPPEVVWHVGRRPQPWAWVPREFAGEQRWDDADGSFRTTYAGSSRYGCYLEVLAQFREDPTTTDGMAEIVVDDEDAVWFPTYPPGEIDRTWVEARVVTSARMTGVFLDVTAAPTIAALRPGMVWLARHLGLPDFDAAALKLTSPRELTQRVASLVYRLPNDAVTSEDPADDLFAGIRFASRHGDDVPLWALFEREDDEPVSRRLEIYTEARIWPDDDEELRQAMAVHNVTWPEDS